MARGLSARDDKRYALEEHDDLVQVLDRPA